MLNPEKTILRTNPRIIPEIEQIKGNGKIVIAVKMSGQQQSCHMGPQKQDVDNMVVLNYAKFNGIEAGGVYMGNTYEGRKYK